MLHGQRISTILNRLWGDIAHNQLAVTMIAASAIALIWLASVGLIDVGRQTRDWWRTRGARHSNRAQTKPEPPRPLRPTCEPRPPTAFEIWHTVQTAERITRAAAEQRDRSDEDEDASP
jgi:hypothetical protein